MVLIGTPAVAEPLQGLALLSNQKRSGLALLSPPSHLSAVTQQAFFTLHRSPPPRNQENDPAHFFPTHHIRAFFFWIVPTPRLFLHSCPFYSHINWKRDQLGVPPADRSSFLTASRANITQ
jgi:hypothetical protein